MSQTPIPCLLMRGGTSRGPFFRRADLPRDRAALSRVLLAVLGSGHPLTIDGLGGGVAVTTKAAMLSPARDGWAEVDYLFAQAPVGSGEVDYAPSCANMLAAVGPAAIELGLVAARDGETGVRIRLVNTGQRAEARVQTPGGRVAYDGGARIDGVPGSAAPVGLSFLDTAGSKTGALFPTGRLREEIDAVALTLIDCAMPMAIARAEAFGLTGYESREALDADRRFFARMEAIRIEAGRRMGLGEVAGSVVPKVAVLAPPRQGGAVTARYFMPWQTHPSLAVSGAICISACLAQPGTVADGVAKLPPERPLRVGVEHPMGRVEVTLDAETVEGRLEVAAATVVRTARLLMRGEVMVPAGLA